MKLSFSYFAYVDHFILSEIYVNNLMKRSVNSRRMGHYGQTMSNLIHHSVAKSVQDVYKTYVYYKNIQAVWMYNKVTHDLSSDQAFRRAISEINTQLIRNVHSLINENQEEFVPERKVTMMSAMIPYHLRPC